jgi:hypothetical protein
VRRLPLANRDRRTGNRARHENGALKGAAVSAAVAAAVYGLRKAATAANERDQHEQSDESGLARSGSLVITALESASDHVLPLAEAAAEEVGRWVARNSPEVVRERLLPRFIDAFKAAAQSHVGIRSARARAR